MTQYVLLFFGSKGHPDKIDRSCLSQWYPAHFVVDDIEYCSAEQYMMAQKAKMFGDKDIQLQIMQTSSPKEAKRLGRLVKGFDLTFWKKDRYAIIYTGNLAKFSQNLSLREYLLETNDSLLGEASPTDLIYGIGLARNDPKAREPKNWKGSNLLGHALMDVRKTLEETIDRQIVCPYCLKDTSLVDSKAIYGRSYGMIWLCSACDAYVGTHRDSKTFKPLGTPANKELREWRKRAHAKFDPLWRKKIERDNCSKSAARKAGYKWLATQMGIPYSLCHIALFNVEQCTQAIALCQPYYK